MTEVMIVDERLFLSRLVRRYKYILKKRLVVADQNVDKTSLPHIMWMLDQIEGMDDTVKISRWIGFVQGVLAARGIIDTIEEIQVSREIRKIV